MTRKRTIAKVLELKEFSQEQIEAEVRKVNDKFNAEKASLNHLEETLKNTVAAFNCKQNKGLLNINIHEMGLLYDYLSHLGKQIEKQRNVVFLLAKELEMKKREMLEAYKEKRIFEKLKDKILHEENKKMFLLEQKEADFNFLSKKSRK
ncbi:MAG: flagellar export protein FliJ [Nitrospirota bacterium]